MRDGVGADIDDTLIADGDAMRVAARGGEGGRAAPPRIRIGVDGVGRAEGELTVDEPGL
jgi:hypothetical protein